MGINLSFEPPHYNQKKKKKKENKEKSYRLISFFAYWYNMDNLNKHTS